MIDAVFFFQVCFIVLFEISILIFAYRTWISKLNFQVWKERISDPSDTTFNDIMEPIIMETAAAVSELVVESLELRYRQSLGVMTNSVKAEGNQDELTTGMMMAESLLKGMGMKSPNIQLIAKLASSMGGLLGQQGQNNDKLF